MSEEKISSKFVSDAKERMGKSLFKTVSDWVTVMIESFFDIDRNPLLRWIGASYIAIVDVLFAPPGETLARLINEFIDILPIPDSRKEERKIDYSGKKGIWFLRGFLEGIGDIIGYTVGLIKPLMTAAEYTAWKATPIKRIEPIILAQLKKRYPWLKDRVDEMLLEYGYDREQIEYMEITSRELIQVPEIASLMYRKFIDFNEANLRLETLGYSDKDRLFLMELFKKIPPISDLIRFSVREVYHPKYREEYGLDDEWPAQFGIDGAKQGYSEEWLKNYWAAHWELPSLYMGYEMLHRGEITDSDLDNLFKALDIMPFWRDKLKAISYKPYTRVDVRRMHKIGVLKDKDLLQAYMDLGYNKEKATNMMDFTIKYNRQTEKDLTKSEVLKGYKKGLISPEMAREQLEKIGYDEEEITYYLNQVDYDKFAELKDMRLKYIKKGYLNGVYNKDDVTTMLNAMALKGAEIDELKETWKIEKLSILKQFNVDQLKGFYLTGIIKKDQIIKELMNINYTEEYAKLLVKLFDKGKE